MTFQARNFCLLLIAASALSGCSGMGTTMTKMGRLEKNQGYQMAADLSVVRAAAVDVLRARGYDVSVQADPESGAEGAGVVVVGQLKTIFNAVVDSQAVNRTAQGAAQRQMETRILIDVYLSKKWQMSSELGVPNVTLVQFAGGDYLRKSADVGEEETSLKSDFTDFLRDQIERAVNASRDGKERVQ